MSELTHYPFDTRDNSSPDRQDPQDAKIADLRARLAAVEAERDRLREFVISAAAAFATPANAGEGDGDGSR
jgi:hypothetical protein